MFTWLIIFVVVGGIVGYFMRDNGKSGAAEGAATGFAAFFTILVKIIMPLALMVFLFRACFG
jgi:hypothetical protein